MWAVLAAKFNWTISRKIPVLMVGVTVLACGTVAGYAGLTSFSTARSLIGTHLEYVAGTKRNILATKLDMSKLDIEGLAVNPALVKSFDNMITGYKILPQEQAVALSKLKASGEDLKGGATPKAQFYLDAYKQIDVWLKSLGSEHGYSNILLINAKGELIYSTGTDPLGAVAPDSPIAQAVRLSQGQRRAVMTDFSPPSKEGPGLAFFAIGVANAMIPDERGGTLVVAVSTNVIDAIMHDSAGFSAQGEALFAGSDGLARSTSRFSGSSNASLAIDKSLLAPKASFSVYRDQEVLAASEPLSWGGQNWSIIAVEPTTAVFAPAVDMLWKILAITAATALFTLLLAVVASRSISGPIVRLVAEMKRLASGDTSGDVEGTTRTDEVGDMSRAVLVFKDNAVAKRVAEEDARRTEAEAESERKVMEADRLDRSRIQAGVVAEIGSSLSALANGTLSHKIAMKFPADYQQLKDDFNEAVTQLSHTVLTVSTQAKSISSIADEMSGAMDTLATRTEHQAIVLEGAVNTLHAVSTDVNRTAEAANKANTIVAEAHSAASSSDEIVSQAIAGMGQIEDSSRQIASIVNVIDEIAFQTNLLALNAGVEASRAGDAGKGFAVVASEVRALAQRSADAAKEIKELINTSSRRVERGTQLVSSTGELLKTIAGQIDLIKSVVSNIASTASNQATHLGAFGATIKEIDMSTQQTAAMAEESTAACRSLAEEATHLLHLISQFDLDENAVQAEQGARAKVA
ncbi:HAMP domain-containing methyl-accepting chemotaxis protein (plasmid) [Rhizobium sp. CB3171]|uniref:methyl-accepting chemotaxis protein n=1 Tax=Rhizobium sp. CB3171 TaxID=3039157 RepID=UPI0024B26D85|nr:HAMP domain-containing methyl-accepting chemotaxis protein [Rhizobium sp. CB3171]WFU05479.1 HAMP domain-containing methyl-accepting chemotaxis protein [Rhizobium sp. CB3171]